MPETLPVDPTGAGASPDSSRDARIEELLLSGLDYYFAGKYEEAINIWTRVVFLERGHGRARAYIERARGAQAEQQRESEEVLHKGIAAYEAGDLAAARALLTRALEDGGPTDLALAFLQRLNRFEAATEPSVPSTREVGTAPVEHTRGRTRWLPTIAASAVLAAAIVLLAFPVASWIAEQPLLAPQREALRPEPLPIVRSSEMTLARARTLYEAGRLRDALGLLERIDRNDPIRADADRLTAVVQRDVLSAAGLGLDEPKGSQR